MSKKAKKVTIKGLNSYHKRNAKGEVVKDKRGKPVEVWKYRFTDKNSVRRVIYLGESVLASDASFYAENLSRLVQCSKTPGAVRPPEVQAFVDGVDFSFRKKLIEVGLILETERDVYEAAATIGTLTDAYLKYHENAIYNTKKGLKLTVDKLLEYFGRDKKLCDITSTEVKHFEAFLYGYSEAYASRLSGRIKEICRFGIREKILDDELFESTFATMKVGKMFNRERDEFVTVDKYRKIVSVCVNTELRFAFFLARFLAFRCPSECNSWRWSMIDFESKRVKVLDVKRKEIRLLPLFGFLYPFFAELLHYHRCKSFLDDIQTKGISLQWESKAMVDLMRERGQVYIADMASRFPKGKDWIFSEAFRSRKSRGKQIPQLLRKAKVTLEKPFVNMRGTCESEWVQRYGIKAACEWTGNSVKVAAKHYLKISQETWLAATEETSETVDIETIQKLLKRYTVEGLNDLIAKTISAKIRDGGEETTPSTESPR